MFEDLKEAMAKELKETLGMMSRQIENINKEFRIVKRKKEPNRSSEFEE